jgi:hemoglobin
MASPSSMIDTTGEPRNIVSDAYRQLGGMHGLATAMRRFYREMSYDPVLHPLFHGSDLNWLAARQTQFVAQALGAPITYKGPAMKHVHSVLGIGTRHKRMVELHLSQSLAEVGLLPAAVARIVELVEPV